MNIAHNVLQAAEGELPVREASSVCHEFEVELVDLDSALFPASDGNEELFRLSTFLT